MTLLRVAAYRPFYESQIATSQDGFISNSGATDFLSWKDESKKFDAFSSTRPDEERSIETVRGFCSIRWRLARFTKVRWLDSRSRLGLLVEGHLSLRVGSRKDLKILFAVAQPPTEDEIQAGVKAFPEKYQQEALEILDLYLGHLPHLHRMCAS